MNQVKLDQALENLQQSRDIYLDTVPVAKG
jgi:hypothetical protein